MAETSIPIDEARACPARFVLFILVACVISISIVLWRSAYELGMAGHLHLRYWAHAIPAVVSHLYHGLKWDFTAYRGIAETLLPIAGQPDALQVVANLHDFDRTILFFPSDDKGYAAFTLIAFRVFGLQISSIFDLYFSLLFLSIAVYVLAFRRVAWALVLLLLTLLAINASLYAMPVSTELGEITNPRAFGILSLVAVYHLIVLAWLGRPSIMALIGATVQSAIIVLVFFCRSPEAWQIITVLVVTGTVILIRRTQRSAALAVAAVLVTLSACLALYQKLTFNPDYFSSKGQLRLFWHNIGVGFALHPGLAAGNNLVVSDETMFRLVKARAQERGIYDQVFESGPTFLLNPIKDFVAYERLCREVVVQMTLAHPLSVLTLFAYYKPRELVRTLLTAMGKERQSNADFEVTYISSVERHRLDAYFRLFRLPAALTLTLLMIVISAGKVKVAAVAKIFAAVFLFSLIPAMLSYPLYHIVAVNFVLLASVAYALLIGAGKAIIDAAIRYLAPWLPSGSAA